MALPVSWRACLGVKRAHHERPLPLEGFGSAFTQRPCGEVRHGCAVTFDLAKTLEQRKYHCIFLSRTLGRVRVLVHRAVFFDPRLPGQYFDIAMSLGVDLHELDGCSRNWRQSVRHLILEGPCRSRLLRTQFWTCAFC